ncbi:hypothetical protein MBLNU230_g5015t1 [Neophaeotheca triangularis]
MATSLQDSCFSIVEHEFEGQHIRGYPDATACDEYPVKLHAKQYIPNWNTDPKPGDTTLICAHANSFWKELYEPLWHDLLSELQQQGVGVRSIWMADFSTQGASGVLNEPHLGHDTSSEDHARDLLAMINKSRDSMPRPLFAIGHSFGTAQLINLSIMHPRLFEGIVLLDPIIAAEGKLMPPHVLAKTTQLRLAAPDLWDTPEAAMKELKRNPLYQGWDPRAERLFFESVLRPTPTPLYPDVEGKWTLRTTKHSGIFAELRANLEGHGLDSSLATIQGRTTHADVDPHDFYITPFYNSAVSKAFEQVKHLRPPVFFVVGSASPFGGRKQLRDLRNQAGIGVGGSGGLALGQVHTAELKGGHLFPMTHPHELARHISAWLQPRVVEVRAQDAERDRARKGETSAERYAISKARADVIAQWNGSPRGKPFKGKL